MPRRKFLRLAATTSAGIALGAFGVEAWNRSKPEDVELLRRLGFGHFAGLFSDQLASIKKYGVPQYPYLFEDLRAIVDGQASQDVHELYAKDSWGTRSNPDQKKTAAENKAETVQLSGFKNEKHFRKALRAIAVCFPGFLLAGPMIFEKGARDKPEVMTNNTPHSELGKIIIPEIESNDSDDVLAEKFGDCIHELSHTIEGQFFLTEVLKRIKLHTPLEVVLDLLRTYARTAEEQQIIFSRNPEDPTHSLLLKIANIGTNSVTDRERKFLLQSLNAHHLATFGHDQDDRKLRWENFTDFIKNPYYIRDIGQYSATCSSILLAIPENRLTPSSLSDPRKKVVEVYKKM